MKFQKVILTIAAVLASKVASFAGFLDVGVRSYGTPYDPYMSTVREVLGDVQQTEGAKDMSRVAQLMKVSYSFRYYYDKKNPYVATMPEITASTRRGDCKAKALWLCDQLGDESVRFVIGKSRAGNDLSHAWVMWNDGAQWWILDPTNTAKPILATSVSKNQYIPLYSYDKRGAYRHASTSVGLAGVAKAKSAVAKK